MVEDLPEGQPEVNILIRMKSHKSWGVISTDYVKDIRHKIWLGYLDLRDPESTYAFVLFCELSLS